MLKRVCPAVAAHTERLALIVRGCRALSENEAETQLKRLVFAPFASQIDFRRSEHDCCLDLAHKTASHALITHVSGIKG